MDVDQNLVEQVKAQQEEMAEMRKLMAKMSATLDQTLAAKEASSSLPASSSSSETIIDSPTKGAPTAKGLMTPKKIIEPIPFSRMFLNNCECTRAQIYSIN